MKPSDKAKAQLVVNEILRGEFDERTVEELFIRLRDSSNGIFRDFGHYIAHSDERDQGMAVQQLSAAYCSIKAFDKYHSAKHEFDVSDLPPYIIDYFHHQLDVLAEIDKKNIKRKFGATTKLHKLINQVFTREADKVVVRRSIKKEELEFFSYLTGLVGYPTIYTKESLIKSVIETVKQNGLNINEEKFKAQSNPFILCLMCKLHETQHKVSGRTKGLCKLTYAYDGAYEQAILDHTLKSFKLSLVMHMIIDCVDGHDMMVCISLLKTDMPAVDHCLNGDIGMLIDREAKVETYVVPDHSSYFKMTKDFKLERIVL